MPVVATLGLMLWLLVAGSYCQHQEELRRHTNYERQFTDVR